MTAPEPAASGGLLAAMRPRQWTKNLLLYAGIVFAAELDDPERWVQATAAFVAYCLASSAAYILNDVRDAERDRLHPLKRDRPIASGRVRPERALNVAGILATLAFAVIAPLGWGSLAYMAGFVALQAAYSFGLKNLPLIDVMAIAGLFVIRAAAGAEAVDVRISPWLIVCTALLALFLALAKRRGELATTGMEAGRPVLSGYSLELVDQLVTIVAACTIVAYSLYTFEAREGSAMMATIPFVVYGLFRYIELMHREDLGEEPENVLLTDVPILVSIVESRSSTLFQPDVIRSTRSERSSTRAWRSARLSFSIRSRRRIVWPASPRTSASWRATGRASARMPSWTASPTAAGVAVLSRAASPPSSSTCARARSSAASTS